VVLGRVLRQVKLARHVGGGRALAERRQHGALPRDQRRVALAKVPGSFVLLAIDTGTPTVIPLSGANANAVRRRVRTASPASPQPHERAGGSILSILIRLSVLLTVDKTAHGCMLLGSYD
jgi:hypothetical protein